MSVNTALVRFIFPRASLGSGIGTIALVVATCSTAGLLLMLALPPDPPFIDVVWLAMVCGIGFGLFQSPNNRALISAAPRSRSGVASGVLSTARLTDQTIGGVLVAVIFVLMLEDIGGSVWVALLVGAAFSGFACAISFLRLT